MEGGKSLQKSGMYRKPAMSIMCWHHKSSANAERRLLNVSSNNSILSKQCCAGLVSSSLMRKGFNSSDLGDGVSIGIAAIPYIAVRCCGFQEVLSPRASFTFVMTDMQHAQRMPPLHSTAQVSGNAPLRNAAMLLHAAGEALLLSLAAETVLVADEAATIQAASWNGMNTLHVSFAAWIHTVWCGKG